MDIPKTLAGSPCKLCTAKGSHCHLHGGTPRKDSKKWKLRYEKEEKEYVENWRQQQEERGRWYTPLRKDIPFIPYEEWLEQHKDSPSPKKSPLKSPDVKGYKDWTEMFGEFKTFDPMSTQESLPMELHKFENLPQPAMMKILLDLPIYQLKYLCNRSRQASKICKEPRFKKKYDKLHSLLGGKLRKTDDRGRLVRLEDNKGVLVLMYNADNNVISALYFPHDQTSFILEDQFSPELAKLVRDEPIGLHVTKDGIVLLGWVTDDEVDLEELGLNENEYVWGFLNSIGKPEWYTRDGGVWYLSDQMKNEFVNIVEKATKKVLPHLKFEILKL